MLSSLLLILVPLASAVVQLKNTGYIKIPDGRNRFQPFLGTADRAAFDAQDEYLYVVGGTSEMLHIIDTRNHANTIVHSREFNEISDGIPKAIDFCRLGELVRVIIVFSDRDRLEDGHFEIFKGFTRLDQTFVREERESIYPDPTQVRFMPNCQRFVITTAGLPGKQGTTYADPVGYATVWTKILDGFTRHTVSFHNAVNRDLARRVFKASFADLPNHELVHDLEPEDVTIDKNGIAYVVFQENNAIGRFDVNNLQTPPTMFGLGVKDWNNADIDTSDRDLDNSPNNDRINMVRRNIRGFYQPADIEVVTFDNQIFILTADTGAQKRYTDAVEGVTFDESIRARLLDDNLLDPNLPADTKTQLNTDSEMGRLYMSKLQQASDGWDTVFKYFKEVHVYGGRGWSIRSGTDLTSVYDSGSDFEYQVATNNKSVFNSDCYSGTRTPGQDLDTRSDDKGPEPKAIATAMFNNKQVVIVGSGRMGGLWVYTVEPHVTSTLPNGVFQSYTRIGEIEGEWNVLYNANTAGTPTISDIIIAEHGGHTDAFVIGSQMGVVAIFELEDN